MPFIDPLLESLAWMTEITAPTLLRMAHTRGGSDGSRMADNDTLAHNGMVELLVVLVFFAFASIVLHHGVLHGFHSNLAKRYVFKRWNKSNVIEYNESIITFPGANDVFCGHVSKNLAVMGGYSAGGWSSLRITAAVYSGVANDEPVLPVCF